MSQQKSAPLYPIGGGNGIQRRFSGSELGEARGAAPPPSSGANGASPYYARRKPNSMPFHQRAAPNPTRWEAFTHSTSFPDESYYHQRHALPADHTDTSQQQSQQQKPSTNTKRYDKTEPCIPYESIRKHLLTHLHGSWCLWYTNVAQKTTENFSDCLIPICVVSTAEAFWALYSHCIRPSQLARGTEYHLFREGIKPMWEDPANQNGGTLMLRLRKDKDYLDYFWESLILAMIGEQLGEDICGAVAGKRYADDHLSIWNRYYDPKNQKALTATLLRALRLPEDGPAEYKSHSGYLKSSPTVQHQPQ
eukprot:Protomagalhaensia_sp_Gyna_25__2429@NODE_2351_length_1134_cov_177_962557_g1947_i0_p1_GENE_NODE_2351_length_1134_cov_177_962557_g1947_i0NODE_2351_length_1134_cov_177_962557_g1947_i0_p1_ORF_typecomplete_len307_score27_64IF4E/PF01652_18/2_4e46_NODE_2351_length_1134_cov_177_962557_g1947_i027947